jgi:LysM repeat protein
MVRSAAAILALFIFTGVAQAQQRHTVVDGETLWSLAQRYYNDPGRWPQIYEANRAPAGQVEDARLIYPGEVLVIPDLAATPVVAAVVVEPLPAPVQPEPAPAPVQPEPAPAPVQPEPAPPPQVLPPPIEPERTVFYSTEGRAGFAIVGTDATRTAVPRDVTVAAPWLGPLETDPPNVGRLIEFAGSDDERVPRTTVMPFDRVQLSLPGLSAARGTELLAFRLADELPGVGQILYPTGVLAVSDPTPDGAVALVVAVFDRVTMGDFLQLLPTFPLRAGVQAQPVTTGPDATIIGFADPHAIQGLNDVAFLDQGSDQGVAIGDEYVVLWDEGSGAPPEIEGRLQVVQVHPDHSSARIVWLRNPVFATGGIVGLDRKMP